MWREYGGYEVSMYGQVKGKRGNIIKPYLKHNGYYAIDLYVDGKKEKHRLNRLVAKVWLPSPTEEGLECHHINANRLDNSAFNLQWVSKQENIRQRDLNKRFALFKTT